LSGGKEKPKGGEKEKIEMEFLKICFRRGKKKKRNQTSSFAPVKRRKKKKRGKPASQQVKTSLKKKIAGPRPS